MPLELGSVPRRGVEQPLLDALYAATGNQQGVNRMLTGNDPYLVARAGMGRFALANPMQGMEPTPEFAWEDNDPVATARAVNTAVAQHSDPGSTASPIMDENGVPTGIRGMRNTQGNAALQDPERIAKQQAHRERVKAMQPQYASMEDRQANVTANAMQRGMGRDARMMGGYGPAIMTQMLAQQQAQPQQEGGGGLDPLMSPLIAMMMGGQGAFNTVVDAGSRAAQMAQQAQIAAQQMQHQQGMAEMGGQQKLAQIQAEADAQKNILTDPGVQKGALITKGGMTADQAGLAMGEPEAVIGQLATSSGGDFDTFLMKAKSRFPTIQEDELAAIYQGATGTDPYAPGLFSTRPRPAGAAPQIAAPPKVQSLFPNVSIDTGYVPDPRDSISGAMSRGWSQQY